MNHVTLSQPSSCFSVLLVAEPKSVKRVQFADTINATLKHGDGDFTEIQTLIPDIKTARSKLSYKTYRGEFGLVKNQGNDVSISDKGELKMGGTSAILNPTEVEILYDSSGSEIKVFDVSFKLSVSTECSSAKKLCNGEAECDDFSDEVGCSAKGAYSRMALSNQQQIYVPPPGGDHTLCFYAFGSLNVCPLKDTNSCYNQMTLVRSKGYNCIVVENTKVKLHLYNSDQKQFKSDVTDVDVANGVEGWHIYANSNVKNIIVYKKVLSVEEMADYISKCGQDGYPASADLYMDHHFLVFLQVFYKSTASGSRTQKRSISASTQMDQINYVVLSSMCEERASPSGSVNLMTSHLCDSGKAIRFHCHDSEYCGDDKIKECEYVKSHIVSLFKSPTGDETCTKAEIVNEHNNLLGVKAISSANTFISDCAKLKCTTEAYLQDLKKGTTDSWTTTEMSYTNWSVSVVVDKNANRPVRLKQDGSWDVNTKPTNSALLCRVGKNADPEKALTFKSASDYSQLKIQKKTVFNKLTMCWAASGSGVLLHYTGLSSISGKDIYIATETLNSRTYLTVYIAGFPEYFDLDANLNGYYVCLRWEKLTGRIDLAINGKLIVGKNTYANSRKINLPSSGKLVVGAEIDTSTNKVDTKRQWSGQINNLFIFNRFFNPLMLKETSRQRICDKRAKAEAWLTFEEVIAGSTNHKMYTNFDHSTTTCGKEASAAVTPQKRQGTETNDLTVVNIISVDYSLYLESNSDFAWVKPSEKGIAVTIINSYSARQFNNQGNLKLDPLSALCFSGGSLKDTSGYNVEVSVYSTGMTSFQIGKQTLSVSAGSPKTAKVENVFPEASKICITNVLSPSDYAPLDGYILNIQYWTNDDSAKIVCPSQNVEVADKGVLAWPATQKPGEVTTTCQYGNVDDYSKIGLATRKCTEDGWKSDSTDTSKCNTKYTISVKEAEDYFKNTEVTDENTEEYASTINQVVQKEEKVTLETMNTAADALNKLSESSKAKISDTTMTTVVEVANTINLNSKTVAEKDTKEEAKTATKTYYTRIVESVATLAAKVELPENEKFVSKTESVSVAAFKPPPIKTSTDGNEESADITASFQEAEGGTNIDISTENGQTDGKSVIKIKREQIDANKNVWFTSYLGNSTLFSSDTKYKLDGQIIGAGIGEGRKKFDDNQEAMMTFYTNDKVDNANALCQYWDMTDGVGSWSSEGMKFVEKGEKNITCKSTHLTNFAILINPSNKYFSGAEELTLQIITIAGCTLSIIGLLATIIGLAVFKQIRSVLTNRVHIGLATSLLFAYIFLLIGPDLVANEGVCYFFSILVHFCFLCAFCWMFCEAVNLYLRLVVVFESYSKMFLKFSVFSIVTPLMIVLITVIVEFAGENGAYIVVNPASNVRVVCWLDYKARMAAFLLPLILILCANFVVFIMVMRVLFASKKSATATNKTHWLSRLRSAVAVSTLIGLSWILGFFALGEASFGINIIFAVCNSLQGVLICYLYCFAKTDVMTKWRSTIQDSFGKSRKDSSGLGLSTSNSGAPRPNARFSTGVNNTRTTSLPLSSKSASVSVSDAGKNGKYNNVYSNEASISLNEVKEEGPVYHGGEEDQVYADLPDSDDDHIYEEFHPALKSNIDANRSSEIPEEDKTKTITLNRNLQGLVKEKVETFEGIIQGAQVVVTCPEDDSEPAKTCPDPSDPCPSFQIKSSSGASGDSKSPFDL